MYLEYFGIRDMQACRCTTCRVRVGYFFPMIFRISQILELPWISWITEALTCWHVDDGPRLTWGFEDRSEHFHWNETGDLADLADLEDLVETCGNWRSHGPRMSPEFPDVFRFSGVVFNFSPFEGASLVLICGSFSDNFHLGDHLGVAFFPFPSPPWSHKLCILSSGAA